MSNQQKPAQWLKSVLLNVANAIYSSKTHFPIELEESRFQSHLLRQWLCMPTHLRLSLYCLSFLVQWGTVLRYGRPMSRLPAEKRSAWLNRWIKSPLPPFRLSIRLLLTVVKPVYFEQNNVRRQIPRLPLRDEQVHSAQLFPQKAPTILPSEKRHQVIVVGTGAGGAVIGAELAKAGLDVAFIEAGRHHSAESFKAPPLETLQQTYRDGGLTVAYGRPNIPIPIGQTVGGSTTINSGTCFRIPPHVSEKLKANRIGLHREVLDPHYDVIERRLSVKTVPQQLLGGSAHVVAKGAEKLGLTHGPLRRNISGCQQSAQCAFGCPTQAKQSMNLTYLPDAIKHGAKLYDQSIAKRILFEGDSARGIQVLDRRNQMSKSLRAETIISACGTVGTVAFLRRSGIESPHLGRHLSIHPASKITALMPDAVNGWQDTPQGYGIFDLLEEGILFEGAFIPPEYASLSLPFIGDELGLYLSNYHRLAIFGLFVADGPNGRVHVLPNGKPLVSYWLSRTDTLKFQQGLKLLSQVFFAAGAESILLPIASKERQDSLEAALKTLSNPISPWDLELVAFHPLGTARMSQCAAEGVVKPDGALWQKRGVYVADGSVFPCSLGVNPQLTIMATAKHFAEGLITKLSP